MSRMLMLALAAVLVLAGCDKGKTETPRKPTTGGGQNAAAPGPSIPEAARTPTPPATQPEATPPPATQPEQLAQPMPPEVIEVPRPAEQRVGQWVRYRSSKKSDPLRLVRIVAVHADRGVVELQVSLIEGGKAIGQPRTDAIPIEGRPLPEQRSVARERLTVPAGTFDCVRVTVTGRDVNGAQFVRRTWYCDRVPVEGIVKIEAESKGRLERSESLEAFSRLEARD